jgi:hypothetical protein
MTHLVAGEPRVTERRFVDTVTELAAAGASTTLTLACTHARTATTTTTTTTTITTTTTTLRISVTFLTSRLFLWLRCCSHDAAGGTVVERDVAAPTCVVCHKKRRDDCWRCE